MKDICSGNDPAPLPIVSNITPCAPILAASATASNSGMASANRTRMRRSLPASSRKPLEAAFRIAAREEAELDVIDAERGGRPHGGANAVTFERQIADGGADRRAAGDMPDASGDGVGRKRAERALAGILQVDDVGAGAERQSRLRRRRARWRGTGSPEQPVEHAAADCRRRRRHRRRRHGARRGGLRRRSIGALEAPEIVAGDGRPLPHLAELNLVRIAVGIGDDDRDGLPVPLRGRGAPGMRLDGDDLVGAGVDDGDIFEARILAVAEIARVIFQTGRCRRARPSSSFHSRILGLPEPNISSSALSAGYFALLAI